MSKALVSTVMFIFTLVSLLMLFGISYINAYNLGNNMEKTINATYQDNQNILAQYSQKIAEAAQIPAMQRDDLVKVVESALSARYGAQGSRAMFQWIQEQNPQIDSSVYIQLQRIIEAGRNEFRIAQTKLIDQKRTYETHLGSFWSGFWLKISGYPSVDLGKFNIITTETVQKTFESGIENGPIKLR